MEHEWFPEFCVVSPCKFEEVFQRTWGPEDSSIKAESRVYICIRPVPCWSQNQSTGCNSPHVHILDVFQNTRRMRCLIFKLKLCFCKTHGVVINKACIFTVKCIWHVLALHLDLLEHQHYTHSVNKQCIKSISILPNLIFNSISLWISNCFTLQEKSY